MPEFPDKIVVYFDDDGLLQALQPGLPWAATHLFRVYEVTPDPGKLMAAETDFHEANARLEEAVEDIKSAETRARLLRTER